MDTKAAEAPSSGAYFDAACGITDRVRDSVLTLLPVEVTEHLVSSRKHLYAAAERLIELEREKADRLVERARAIHDRLRREREEERARRYPNAPKGTHGMPPSGENI